MLDTSSIAERNVVDSALPPITLADSVAQDIIKDTSQTDIRGEIVAIYLFNCGNNNAYVAYGRDCDSTTNFNAYIIPGQMLRVETRQRVSMFSPGGTVIARTVLRRVETPYI